MSGLVAFRVVWWCFVWFGVLLFLQYIYIVLSGAPEILVLAVVLAEKKNRSHHADQNHITDRITAGRRPIIDRTAWAAMVPLKTKPFGWAFSGTVAAHSVVRSVMGQPPGVVRSVIRFWRRSTICYFFSAQTTVNFLMGGVS